MRYDPALAAMLSRSRVGAAAPRAATQTEGSSHGVSSV
jgi:hypothetical protein